MFLQITFFILGTAIIAFITRRSLQPGTHGFYRFLAWTAMLGLLILNIPRWFANPFAPHQLISWILLLASFVPLVLGVRLLSKQGMTRGEVEGSANYAFENTTRLVTSGIFRYIRHPMYASLFYFTWGIYAKDPSSIAGVVLSVSASIFLFLTARREEEENIRTFGADYEAYMKRTKRFIPWLF